MKFGEDCLVLNIWRSVAQQFSTYIGNFVKTGNPNGKDLPNWPGFNPTRFDLMDFALNGPVYGPEPRSGVAFVKKAAETGTTSQNAPAELGGTSWQLVRFQGSDDSSLTPDDRAKYTIAFATDGRLTARIDCNRGRGTWKSSGRNQIQFGPLALTRAMCPPGSLHDQIVKNWKFVRS
jgi:para-nitrobenzyl esterase